MAYESVPAGAGGGGGGGGVTDHGALTGLGDNDHPHYTLTTTLDALTLVTTAATSGNKRRLVAGSNVTLDTSVANEIAIAASGGGAPTGAAGGDLDGTYPNPTLDVVAAGGTVGGGASFVNQIVYDTKGRVTSVTAGTPAAADIDFIGTLRTLAAAKLGVSAANLLFEYRVPGLSGTNGMTPAAGSGASGVYVDGALKLSRGTSAGSIAYTLDIGNTASSTRPMWYGNGAADKWWMCAYMQFDTGVSSSSLMGVGAPAGAAGSAEMIMGSRGASSTANFVLYGSTGAYIDSGVALDMSYHLHQGYRDGTNSYYQIDANSPVSGTARPTNAASLYAVVFDTVAADRSVRYVVMAAARVKP